MHKQRQSVKTCLISAKDYRTINRSVFHFGNVGSELELLLRIHKQLLALSAPTCVFLTFGTVLSAMTTEDAVVMCKGYPDASYPRNCEAYFQAGREYLLSDDPSVNPKGKLCLEETFALSDMIALVVGWIEEHPDQVSASLFDAMHSALSTRFACQ